MIIIFNSLKLWAFYCVSSFLTAIFSLRVFTWLTKSISSIFIVLHFLRISRISLELVLFLDATRIIFLSAVLLITSSVLLFRVSYMSQEKFFNRFHTVLILFVVSIALLVLSPSLFSALVGWDGLGITSYILVIYYGRSKARNAGIITALTNRLGDGGIILCLCRILTLWDPNIFWYTKFWDLNSLIPALLVISCFTKSAQIPFSAWLPAAIAAPTPVSSLVHSSTLVTAGVYLLIRHTHWPICSAPLLLIVILGSLTMFIARISAFYERDIKKVVALSTLRQLGVIVVALGLNMYLLALIHLLAHAFFKALLFISVGNLIHSNNDYQALSLRGNLTPLIPRSYSSVTICSLSLAGFPFMSAFFSKEPIIELCNNSTWLSNLLFFIIFIGVIITGAYRVRLAILTGLSTPQGQRLILKTEMPDSIIYGILLLFLGAILGGRILISILLSQPLYFHRSRLSKLIILLALRFRIWAGLSLTKKCMSPKSLTFIFHIWSLPWISSILIFKPSKKYLEVLRLRDLNWVWSSIANYSFYTQKSHSLFLSRIMYHKILLLLILSFILFLLW